jgi:hypothetical protein
MLPGKSNVNFLNALPAKFYLGRCSLYITGLWWKLLLAWPIGRDSDLAARVLTVTATVITLLTQTHISYEGTRLQYARCKNTGKQSQSVSGAMVISATANIISTTENSWMPSRW